MAAPLLLRSIPLFRHRLQPHRLAVAATLLTRRPCSTLTRPDEYCSPSLPNDTLSRAKSESLSHPARIDDPDYRKWKEKEKEILEDIKPIILFAKDIIHSSRSFLPSRLINNLDELIKFQCNQLQLLCFVFELVLIQSLGFFENYNLSVAFSVFFSNV